MLILLYGFTTWALTKCLEKKLNRNCTRMLRAGFNKFWKQNFTKQPPYSHLPPIWQTIQVRRTRHSVHCWRNKDNLISDVLLWTRTRGRNGVGRLARTYWADSGSRFEDLPGTMKDRDRGRKRVREICAVNTTWRWWRWCKKVVFNRWPLCCFKKENILSHCPQTPCHQYLWKGGSVITANKIIWHLFCESISPVTANWKFAIVHAK